VSRPTPPPTPVDAEITYDDILAARERILPWVRRTPVLESAWLNAQSNAALYFKCENLQEIGAFKARGASNAILSLPAEALRAGVVTHSSGNHGAAVAWAAGKRQVRARVVMPRNSSTAKIESVRRYGGEVLLCEPSLAAREALAAEITRTSGAAFIHPYDDPKVIAGQGTVALELLEQLPQLDVLLVPVGGGGLASGVAVAARALRPELRLIGVEPAGADDASRSFHSGVLSGNAQPQTLADGLRASLSPRTFGLIRAHMDDVVTVSEQALVPAMRALWTALHVMVEVSSSVPYAALLERRLELSGARVGIVLTGGNVDLDSLPWATASNPA
jgi:threonine dehydratase